MSNGTPQRCSQCGGELLAASPSCPFCGQPLVPPLILAANSARLAAWLTWVILGIWILGGGALLYWLGSLLNLAVEGVIVGLIALLLFGARLPELAGRTASLLLRGRR